MKTLLDRIQEVKQGEGYATDFDVHFFMVEVTLPSYTTISNKKKVKIASSHSLVESHVLVLNLANNYVHKYTFNLY